MNKTNELMNIQKEISGKQNAKFSAKQQLESKNIQNQSAEQEINRTKL